jgi:molybdate transport system permease protein
MSKTLDQYQGVTLFVTHNMEEAYRVCPNLLVMEHGKVVHYGSKYDIFEHPATVSVAQITGCKNLSNVIIHASQELEAVDWGCRLQVIAPISQEITHIGIRAHHLKFTQDQDQDQTNTFPCWLARTSETPHRITLFLKLNSPANDLQDYHLQAEVSKEKWAMIKNQSFPWYVRLDPLSLILLGVKLNDNLTN